MDLSPYALERAADAAAVRGPRRPAHAARARRPVVRAGWRLRLGALCRSTHAFGGFGDTLELAGRHVNADGILMVGEGSGRCRRRRRR
ncbi:hypothetical protein V2I01_41120 [Micromonospora sp. BRA006-A]|nr:hypothetical protein [Micromonospora sp. BRA006-A]